jgi:hypothetical protein
MPDPFAHRRGEPRTFAAAWVAYLFGGVAVSLAGVGSLGLVATDVYRFAARQLIAITFVAIWVFWPMLRLSQEPPRSPARSFFVDALLVLAPALSVIWPQAFSWMAAWPVEVCLALSIWAAAWSMAVAAILTWYFAGGLAHNARQRPARWVMMLVMLAVACVGPLAGLLFQTETSRPGTASEFDAFAMSGPVSGAMHMVQDRSYRGVSAGLFAAHWVVVLSAAGIGVLAWSLAALCAGDEA